MKCFTLSESKENARGWISTMQYKRASSSKGTNESRVSDLFLWGLPVSMALSLLLWWLVPFTKIIWMMAGSTCYYSVYRSTFFPRLISPDRKKSFCLIPGLYCQLSHHALKGHIFGSLNYLCTAASRNFFSHKSDKKLKSEDAQWISSKPTAFLFSMPLTTVLTGSWVCLGKYSCLGTVSRVSAFPEYIQGGYFPLILSVTRESYTVVSIYCLIKEISYFILVSAHTQIRRKCLTWVCLYVSIYFPQIQPLPPASLSTAAICISHPSQFPGMYLSFISYIHFFPLIIEHVQSASVFRGFLTHQSTCMFVFTYQDLSISVFVHISLEARRVTGVRVNVHSVSYLLA